MTRITFPLLIKITGSHNDSAEFQKEIAVWKASLKSDKEFDTKQIPQKQQKKDTIRRLYVTPFDPNTITSDELKNMGLNPFVIRSWVNFRKKGGRFKTGEDLKIIYGMDSLTYYTLKEFATISQTAEISLMNTKETDFQKLEINTAAQFDFEKLPGIGPVLSERIVKYRSLLGGYVDIQQIREVYGITDSLFTLLENHIIADTSKIKKLEINSADQKSLAKHPYIRDYYAKGILNYRKITGKINSVNELKNNNILPDTLYSKIAGYLFVKREE